MEDNKHTQGEWYLNNPINDDGNIIIKRNPQYGDQEYFAICIKNSFNLVGFYYPSSKQSEPEMIANAKIICKAVNEYDTLAKEVEELREDNAALRSDYEAVRVVSHDRKKKIDTLVKERELLIEALANLVKSSDSIIIYHSDKESSLNGELLKGHKLGNTVSFLSTKRDIKKAKELLNNFKNKKQ